MPYLIAFIFLFPTAVFSQSFTASLDADFTADGLIDRAQLVETATGGFADLKIWHRQADDDLVLETTALDFVWVGGEAEKPLLFPSKNGGLEVFSINREIPRAFWDQKLIINWHSGGFAVTGFTYNWRDMDKEITYTCKADFLAAEISFSQQANGVTDGVVNKTGLNPIALASWDLPFPKECEPVSY